MNAFFRGAPLFLILALQACSSIPPMPALPEFNLPFSGAPKTATADPVLPESATPRERVGRAIDLLGAGKVDDAKAELAKVLKASPKDAIALRLMAQIETDPVTLLGADSRDYVVAAGDTMSALAGQHLGDPLMFFALSRYNGLNSPNALSVGKVLKIPSRAGKQPDVVDAIPASRNEIAPLPPAASTAGNEAANAIRLQALDLLNRGDVTKALGLLRQAEAMNQSDPAIQRDIQRALRIQSALGGG